MAKKKKNSNKLRSQKTSWYPKIIAGAGCAILVLAAYCYFIPQSSSIPVIHSRDHPKRTRAVPVEKTTYAVYDRLAGQSKQDTTRLLPPDEVPDWHPAELDDQDKKAPQGLPPNQMVQNGDTKNVQGAQNPLSSEKTAPLKTQSVGSAASEKQAVVHKTPPKTVPLKQVKAPEKQASGSLGKKTANKNDAIKNPRNSRASVRLQIGKIQSNAQKAEKIIQNIRKKGRMPPHMSPMIQKASIKGKTVYRVILVGRCSEKDLQAYQRYVG